MTEDNSTKINETFLKSVLQTDVEDKIDIIEFTTSPAVEPGNNYMSYIYRVRVAYKTNTSLQTKTESLIVKIPLETGMFSETSESCGWFDKEPQTYRALLPTMYKKLNIEFGPKSFVSPIKNVVVMEDLKKQGFIMKDRSELLDYSHCKHVFETIAKFHAASVSCYHDDPEFISKTVGIDGLWENGSLLDHWVRNSIDSTLKVVQEINGDKRFEEFLRTRAEHILEFVKVAVQPKLKGLNVLNHGDLKSSNILFKYNQHGNITDAKFLDFQVTKFASPVVDLIYFVWTSANDEVLRDKQENLYEVYVTALNNSLQQLGCQERLSLEELWEDLKGYKDYALFVICVLLSFTSNAADNIVDFSSFSKEDFNSSKYKKIFSGDLFKSHIFSITNHFSDLFLGPK